jgi:hypothetical protein
MIREAITKILERVSRDCSTGNGPMMKIKGWIIGRTSHLDDPRPPSEKERDDGFYCDEFSSIIKMFLRKRPMNVADGKYHLIYKDKNGYQNCVVSVNNEYHTMTFITIMQLNKRNPDAYKIRGGDKRIFIGKRND